MTDRDQTNACTCLPGASMCACGPTCTCGDGCTCAAAASHAAAGASAD